MKYITQCKKSEINILKIEICLTITKINNLKKKYFTYSFLAFKNLCNKRTQTLRRNRR